MECVAPGFKHALENFLTAFVQNSPQLTRIRHACQARAMRRAEPEQSAHPAMTGDGGYGYGANEKQIERQGNDQQ